MNASHHTLGAPKSQAGPGACARHTHAPDFPTGVPSLAPRGQPQPRPTRATPASPHAQLPPRPTRATPASSRAHKTGSSHFGVWGWCSKRPGDCGQCRGTTTEHRSSPREPHQPKLARNSDTRTLCSTPKRCNSNGVISTFEIYVGELRATFLRNHNMRRHKDPSRRHPKPGRQPKRKTTQAEDNSSTEDPRNPDSRHNRHKHGGTAPVTWRCTRYVAVHPLRGGAPEQKRCIAYGSGAAPQQTRTNAELAHRTTHRHTPPCAPGPYWRQDGHAAHATTCTPAHSGPLRHLLHP